jgi:hypothetical protein
MARIRTIKPEAWDSEDLASVSVTAVLTFFGLLTLADDAGRFRAHPAIIHGRLWALRPEHTPVHVAADLEQLARAGLICLYTGCDGRTYLHIVTWSKHQKIDRPSASRLPECPEHGSPAKHGCGGCGEASCTNPHRGAPASVSERSASVGARRDLDRPASPLSPPSPNTSQEGQGGRVIALGPVPDDAGECAGQAVLVEASMDRGEGSSSGSRTLDHGPVPVGRKAPAPDSSSAEASAKDLLGEYIAACNRRPPSKTIGHLGKEIRLLLGEGFDPTAVRAGLDKLRAKGLHPSVLHSVVNEIVNGGKSTAASGAGGWSRSPAPGYVPYQNPGAPVPAVFGIGGRR